MYSVGERVLLAWLNYCYENFREKIWKNEWTKAEVKTAVNFDVDLSDGLVLAATIGAYCPFLV